MTNDNVAILQSDMRLKTMYDKVWAAMEESNRANPLSNAACIGILKMIETELTLVGLGLIGKDV